MSKPSFKSKYGSRFDQANQIHPPSWQQEKKIEEYMERRKKDKMLRENGKKENTDILSPHHTPGKNGTSDNLDWGVSIKIPTSRP